MQGPPGYNYAKGSGIDSVAGAVIFAILYVPLLGFFLRQSFARPTYVFIVLSIFSAIRIAAFAIRALLASSESAGENINILIVFDILYNIGFFGLLYSAYTLVLDRGLLSDAPLPNGPISRITRRRPLFRICLTAAVAVGITGAIEYAIGTKQSTIDLGNTLRKVSLWIFLVLSVLVLFQTYLLIRSESSYGTHKVSDAAFGARHGIVLLCVISLLLVAREAFFVATAGNQTKANDENLWYPLAATTEFIAVILFAAPGLVPSRAELPT
ncbi:hypothetical protein CONPUDRAFT_70536 [Coniophora puteana RWD-64-598 SS2]|uniref:RTA1 like protein n=1 Tax=Coniophora puteana (strain RWD-64-598) TaxID=741705 RepID=A0A5M3N366_CONPW|nr:uncharacterized protein CONPUDRAFT_70536 [Coniophora puteana RWD-64-598 SS2]EIW85842.1 hypothetical protein CONPUDRAFT_70536 [Coniophora puteana RWD-64-598 SS2]